MVFPLFLLVLGCKSNRTSINSESIEEEIVYDYDLVIDKTINWSDIFNQQLEKYLVYVFSETCGHCNEIKEDIIKQALVREDFFFVSYSKEISASEDVTNTIGKSKISEISILGTPALLGVENGILISNVAGQKAILQAL